MKKLREERAITLVALVVTIVVLLILAGVTINLVVGQNGIIARAKEAAQKTENATKNEMMAMDNFSSDIERLSFEGGSWNSTLGICTPKLGNNMVGVYWSDGSKNDNGTYKASLTSTEKEVTSDQVGFSWADWYNYKAETTEKLDSKQNKWANAKSTVDGSYFVWIPRYEYKILSGEHTSTAGKIDVQFINTNVTKADKEGYKVHPAFTTNLKLGGWDKDISGIWVAKYEMSMEQTTDNGATWNNVELTSSTGSKTTNSTIRAVSKPNNYSWNYINISNCFMNSLNYSTLQLTGSNSHLMKNSEWGAIAYLTHSKYGRNENEIAVNAYNKDSVNYAKITGIGGASIENKYDTEGGMNASTTGNIYGIYDLSGGNWEYVSILYSKYINGNGTVMYQNTKNKKYIESDINSQSSSNSSKYVTIYPIDLSVSEEDGSIDIYYTKWNKIYGDAIYETSSQCGTNFGWFSDETDGDSYEKQPFVTRGGWYNRKDTSGIFSFGDNNGTFSSDQGYRLVLVCE